MNRTEAGRAVLKRDGDAAALYVAHFGLSTCTRAGRALDRRLSLERVEQLRAFAPRSSSASPSSTPYRAIAKLRRLPKPKKDSVTFLYSSACGVRQHAFTGTGGQGAGKSNAHVRSQDATTLH